MKNLFTSLLIAGLLFTTFTSDSNAQDDCCGVGSIFSSLIQSGIFGGYGIQMYSAEGLNAELPEGFEDYGTAMGWRVGANIIQLQHEQLMMGLKFYFQSSTETQEVTGTYNGEPATQELKLILSQFNLGMSFSYIISNSFDIRIFDIYIAWTNGELSNTIKSSNAPPEDVYKSPDTNTGFTADAGIVYYPFPPYVSLEVLGGYSLFSVETVELEGGSNFPTSNTDVVDGGGFFAVAVLTVGLPFN